MADEDLELLFSQAPIGEMPLDLVFGDDDSVVIPPIVVDGGTRITGIRRSIGARLGARLFSNLKITGMRRPVGVYYDVNVDRPLVSRVITSAQQGLPADVSVSFHFEDGRASFTGVSTSWSNALGLSSETSVHFGDGAQSRQRLTTQFEDALRLGTLPCDLFFEDGIRKRVELHTRFEEARRVSSAPVRLLFQDGIRLRRYLLSSWSSAKPLMVPLHTRFTPATPLDHRLRSPFQEAWPPRPGSRAIVPPEPQPCYVPGLPIELLFDLPAGESDSPVNLVFVCGGETPEEPGAVIVVPIRKTYIVINELELRRVDGNLALPAYTLAMSLDADSWTWQWSATLHKSTLAKLEPAQIGEPVEVEAIVNGVPYRLLVESVRRDRSFAQTRIAVSGRGIAAHLDAPYAPTLSFSNDTPRTAQQLMADALTINGVPIGWEVDWKLVDWLVPAGAWAHQGSYISAINAIAATAGGYVQPHLTEKILRILPRYPHAPWNWGSVPADIELPMDPVAVEGVEWVSKPSYNRVFVSGESQGVLGQVTRGGTAGDVIAPMVTDALITHADAARQRGIALLSDTGPQALVSLRLPVLPETGLILPGKLIRRTDGADVVRGIVRSMSLDWNAPGMRQTIEVQTHA